MSGPAGGPLGPAAASAGGSDRMLKDPSGTSRSIGSAYLYPSEQALEAKDETGETSYR